MNTIKSGKNIRTGNQLQAGECKHLRVSGIRVENGYGCECLACGFTWFKKDKPLTEAEKADKARFEHSQSPEIE